MKRLLYPLLITLIGLSTCTNNKKETTEASSIEMEKAMSELTELKASDFGKTIRYVALETTDESLVGNNPDIIVLKDKIIITTVKQCLVFDKNTGKFISKIGHIGDDPEAYSNTNCWVDEANDMLYFLRRPNQLIGYDTGGNYKGKIVVHGQRMPSYFVFNGETFTGAYNNEMSYGENSLATYNRDGEMMDSIPTSLTPPTETMNDIQSISVLKDMNKFGNWAKRGVVLIDYTDDKHLTSAPDSEVLWVHNNEVRFKELFNDTIYTVTKNKLDPYITFRTGSWHWPDSERTSTTKNNQRLVVSYVKETGNKIFFQCIKGLYTDAEAYDGLFDKNTGMTKLAKSSNKIADDINSFLPVHILTISSVDEYAGLIEAPDALEWLEENPGSGDDPELAFLNNLTEDMNPIVVLIK